MYSRVAYNRSIVSIMFSCISLSYILSSKLMNYDTFSLLFLTYAFGFLFSLFAAFDKVHFCKYIRFMFCFLLLHFVDILDFCYNHQPSTKVQCHQPYLYGGFDLPPSSINSIGGDIKHRVSKKVMKWRKALDVIYSILL